MIVPPRQVEERVYTDRSLSMVEEKQGNQAWSLAIGLVCV